MVFESMKEHMFGLFYVMLEGADGANDGSKVFSMLLLTIDMLQVVRVLGTIRFGWTVESQAFLRWFDLVAVITDQLRRWVPYVCFYVLAVVLVIAAIADAMYVVKLFRDGVLNVIWPLKVLRLMVASIVTIVFTTVLDWLLYPVDCFVDPMLHASLTAWLHGKGSACKPFGMPEIFIAIPTIILAVFYIIFSVGTNLFAFELDPISRQPLAICTGRVEAAWTLFKVAAGLLPFLSEGLSPLASSIIISLFAARVFWYHLTKLPFQCGYSNKFRGGIHAHVLWLCLSGIATSSVAPGWEGRQTLEWVLIAVSPLAFFAGVKIVWWRIHNMDRFLNRLHAEYEVSLLENDSASEFGGRKRSGGQGLVRGINDAASVAGQSVKSAFSAVERPKSRSVYETFFDTEWEARRAFSTGGGAYVCCRRLLARRDAEDLPFLNFMVGKAIAEHPDCLDLLLFQLVVLRFIFRDTTQANDQQKKILANKGIRLDRAFHLYAVIRRATQDSVSTSLGQGGSLSAVNLMEFDSRMTTARRSHQNCLSLMKKFWHLVLKQEKSGSSAYGRPSPALIEDMVHCVNDYEVAIEDAKSEYRWLMEKFPHSISVILSHAHFTDTVINDIKAATKLHTLAAVLENGEVNAEEEMDKGMADGVSSVSSESDARGNIFKFMQSWRSDIVGMEFATLRALQTHVMVCVFFILIISTVGFIMIDLVLFSEQAKTNIYRIDVSGYSRSLCANSAFWTYGNSFARMSRLGSAIRLEEIADNDYTFSQTSEQKRGVMFVQETVFREAIPFFSDMVTIYETKVKEFGNTATIVTVIIAVINALLNIILIVMTLNTVRVITLVKAEVVACRLALALPRSTGKKIHAYYKEEHLKLSALGDEQADKDGIMAEEDPDTQRRGSIHGSVQGLQDLMAFKFGRPPSIASIDNEASAKLRITDPIKTPSPPDDVAGMEPNGDTAVASNPETWEKSFDQRFSISKHLLNERLVMGPTMTLNFGTPPNGGRLKSAMKHTTSVGSGSTASRHGAATPPSPVPWSDRRGSDPTNQTPAAAVWDQGPSDPSSQGAAAKQSTQLVTSVNLSEHPLLLWDDDRELERFSLQDDKDVSERSELNHSDIDRSDEQRSDSDRSDEPSDKDSSDEDHSTSDESEHEQHSLLVGEGERVSVGGSNFGASGGGVVRQDVSPAARPAAGLPESEGNAQESEGEGGYKRPPMNTQGSFKNSPWGKVGQLVRSGSLKKQIDQHKANRAEADRFKLRIPEEEEKEEEEKEVMVGVDVPKKLLVSIPVALREADPDVETDVIKSVVSRQSFFNRSSTYSIVLFALFTISICSVVVPWRFVGQMVYLGPIANQAEYRRCLVKSCAHLTRELVLNDGFSRMTQGETAGTLDGMLAQLRQSDKAVRRGNLLRVGQGADYWSTEHNHVMYEEGCSWKKDGNCSNPDFPTSGDRGVFELSLMFMESVETVLQTYGGPKDKWIDTFGVPRDIVAANAVASAITYDGSRDSLLASDKAVHFVLQGFSGDLLEGYGLVLYVLEEEMSTFLGSVHFELRLLFGVYIALLLFWFFFLLFRRTIAASYEHTERARDFVQMLPTHTLTRGELELLRDHFCGFDEE